MIKPLKFLSAMLTMAAVAVMLTFTSCGDDDDEPENPAAGDSKYTSATVAYDVNLSDDYYKFYDVKVIFVDGEGQLVSGAVAKNQNFGYTIPVAKLPGQIRFAIQLTAKTPLPEFDRTATYTFSSRSSLKVSGNKADGNTGETSVQGISRSITIAGEKMEQYLAVQERVLGPVEYSTEAFTK